MFEFNENSTDRDLLIGFVLSVERFVSTIIRDGYAKLVDDQSVDSPSKRAGGRPKTNLHLHPEVETAAREALDEFIKQRRGDLLIAIDRASTEKLQSHGLDGKQLRFKLRNVRMRERRFFRWPTFSPLRRVIGAIDTLLDSIVDALGVGGVLKELKDAVFDATEDEREPRG